MPELPEITVLARDMHHELAGRTIAAVEVLQPKCLNLPAAGLAPWHAPIGQDGYSSPGSRL